MRTETSDDPRAPVPGQVYDPLGQVGEQYRPTQLVPTPMQRVNPDQWRRHPRRNRIGTVVWCLTCNRCLVDDRSAFCKQCRQDWSELLERRARWSKPNARVMVAAEDLRTLQDFRDYVAIPFTNLVSAHLEAEPLEDHAREVINELTALLLHIENLPDPRPDEHRDPDRL